MFLVILMFFTLSMSTNSNAIDLGDNSNSGYRVSDISYALLSDDLGDDFVIKNIDSVGFVSSKKKELAQSYYLENIWIRFSVNHQDQNDWYLTSVYTQLETFDSYYRPIGTNDFQLIDRDSDRDYSFQIKKGNNEYLLKLKSFGIVAAKFELQRYDFFKKFAYFELVITAILVGGNLSLLVYMLFLWLMLKDSLYLNYVVTTLVNSIPILIIANFPQGIIHYVSPSFSELLPFYRFIFPLAAFMFALQLLKPEGYLRKISKIYMLILCSTPILALNPSWTHLVRENLDQLFFPGLFILIYMGLKYAVKGSKTAVLYLMSQLLFLVFMFFYLLALQGGLEFSYWTRNINSLGIFLQNILMAFALASKVNELREEKHEAQLESGVRLRTTQEMVHIFRVISHDISNALQLVSSSVFVAHNNDKDSLMLRKAVKGINNLIGIINQVKSHQQYIEQGGEICLDSVSLAKVVGEVEFLYEKKAKDKGVKLQIIPGKDYQVKAVETTLINQVLGNLVGNAIKFTEAGKSVTVTWEDRASEVVLKVIDEGVGLSKEALMSIEKEGKVKSTPSTSGEKGTGYGMQIAIRSIQSFFGKLEVKSQQADSMNKNSGTEFSIYLNKVDA